MSLNTSMSMNYPDFLHKNKRKLYSISHTRLKHTSNLTFIRKKKIYLVFILISYHDPKIYSTI